jgi:phosphoglycolate phosphatase
MHRPAAASFVDRFRAVAFDLDGTLVDSAPDLAAAANGMLAALGHRALPVERVAAAIGDGIDALVARALAESTGREPNADELAAAASRFREIYAKNVFRATRIYPGVKEGLERLAGRGLRLGCITNKASPFTKALLEEAGLARWFAFVECADSVEQRKPAPYLLLKACRDLRIAPSELLYVGDSALDVAAARAAGCPVVMVAYGYNRGRPASESAADAVIATLADLAGMRAAFPTHGMPPRELPPEAASD